MATKRGEARRGTGPQTKSQARLVAVGAPREYPLGSREIAIGSAADNQVVVSDPTVSRHHARIVHTLGGFRIIDLDSTNGTFVNGKRIRRPRRLSGGDEIRFGTARFRFLLTGARAGAAPIGIRLKFGTKLGLLALLFVAGFAGMQRVIRWRASAAPGAPPALEASANPPRPAPSVAPAVAPLPAPALAPLPAPAPAPVPAPVAGEVESRAAASSSVASAPISPPVPEPEWLARLNYYRALAKLPLVADDPELSKGDRAHAEYMVRNYGSAIKSTGLGPEAHTEDQANRWFTPEGLAAAKTSDVDAWYFPAGKIAVPAGVAPDMWSAKRAPGTPAWSIDGWMSIPFHRLPMLGPSLRRAGFGDYCESGICAAALNVAGALSGPIGGGESANSIEFPPDGSTIEMRSFGAEWPDPRTSCPGFEPPSGLAITLQVGSFTDVRLGSYSLSRIDGGAAPVEACGFDQASYVNPDPTAQDRARRALNTFGAVVIVPRHPLAAGASYQVSIEANGKPYQWTFSISR
ncbi:MAG TPA: FHA domain-containing protein [Candidatus Binataceae bacterium]|nr:FHA domain-containing protein [Candidatus Binataceae bacterium]